MEHSKPRYVRGRFKTCSIALSVREYQYREAISQSARNGGEVLSVRQFEPPELTESQEEKGQGLL